jgi:MFS family permease
MATLVVGPFYLARALGLDTALLGFVLSVGPLVAALSGVPAGRSVDRFGAQRMSIVGLIGVAAGSLVLSLLPATLGIAGYVAPIVVVTAGYALFQAANNTAVMTDVRADQRGVISGLLNLSRNLGLVTGAAVMGAVFALASAAVDITTAQPAAVATGMRVTFAVAALLIGGALAIALRSRALGRRRPVCCDVVRCHGPRRWRRHVINSNAKELALGLLGGAFGLTLGVLALAFGVAFALTGWTLLGVGSAYYAIGGLVIGVSFLIAAVLVRRQRDTGA